LAWRIEFTPAAARQLGKLGRTEAARIIETLETRIALRDDPRSAGHALLGDWTGFWRYRIGDYRVIAEIRDGEILILVVRIAHRREVYR